MNEPFSHKEQLKAFINTAQYLAGLTSGQDIWEEAAKVLVKFFGADSPPLENTAVTGRSKYATGHIQRTAQRRAYSNRE